MPSLPTQGQAGPWGTQLNEFLSVAHNASGTHKIATLDIREFGTVDLTGGTDLTSFIQSAINTQVASSVGITALEFPYGIYPISELTLGDSTHVGPRLIGRAGDRRPIFRYNGAGGAGSAMISVPVNGGAYSQEVANRIRFEGFAGGTSSPIVDKIIRFTGTTNIDMWTRFDMCHFLWCFGDAISNPNGIVNFHLGTGVRWDAIGGYCVALVGNSTMENRPMTVEDFTYDNGISGNFVTAATAQGYYDGSHWGKGFLSLIDCPNLYVHIKDGRIELNNRVIAQGSKRNFIYVNNQYAGFTRIVADNVVGFFPSAEHGVFLQDGSASPRAQVSFVNGSHFDYVDDVVKVGPYTETLDVVTAYDPRMASAATAINANEARGIRITIPRSGLLTDLSVYVGTSSGNIDAAVFDTSGSTRNALWRLGSTVCPASNGWRILGQPNLMVRAGEQYDLVLAADNATATFGRGPTPVNVNILNLPTGFLPSQGANRFLGWQASTSFPIPVTLTEASMALATPPLVIARIS